MRNKNINLILILSITFFNYLDGVITHAKAYRKIVNGESYNIFSFGDFHVGDKNLYTENFNNPNEDREIFERKCFNILKFPSNANVLQANYFSKLFKAYKNKPLILFEDMTSYKFVDSNILGQVKKLVHKDMGNDHVFFNLKNQNFANIPHKSFDFRFSFLNGQRKFSSIKSYSFEKNFLIKELKAIFDKLFNVKNDKLRSYFKEKLSTYYDKIDLLIYDLNFLTRLVDFNILYEIETGAKFHNKFIFSGLFHMCNIHEGIKIMGYEEILSQGENFSFITKLLLNALMQKTRWKNDSFELKALNIENFFKSFNNIYL